MKKLIPLVFILFACLLMAPSILKSANAFFIYLPYTVGGIATATPTPSPTPTSPPEEGIYNADFELGRNNGWSEYSTIPGKEIVNDFLPVPAHSGTWGAWFGGIQDVMGPLNDTITTITTTQMSGITFWYFINSSQWSPNTYCFFDCMRIYVRHPGQAWVQIGQMDVTYDYNTTTWQEKTLTFAPGEWQLRFAFTYGSDDRYLSNILIDDVESEE